MGSAKYWILGLWLQGGIFDDDGFGNLIHVNAENLGASMCDTFEGD